MPPPKKTLTLALRGGSENEEEIGNCVSLLSGMIWIEAI